MSVKTRIDGQRNMSISTWKATNLSTKAAFGYLSLAYCPFVWYLQTKVGG
ncbi:MAG: hypothetical protein ABFD12_10190 [Syntrophorhabdus sp.]